MAQEAIHMASVHFETLRRALEIIGDDKTLADMLGVKERQLGWWKAEKMPIPEGVFLKCVDIVFSDAIHQKHSSDKDKSN
jgi:hypothetical protein